MSIVSGPRSYVAVFTIVVVAAAVYLFAIATPVYVVDTTVSVRSANSMPQPSLFGGGLSGLAEFSTAKDESYTIVEYIESRQALQLLDKKHDLRKHFSANDIDFLQRMSPDADFETFYGYYGSHIRPVYDSVTGLIRIEVRAFDAQFAHEVAQTLLARSEDLINHFNERARRDLFRYSGEEIEEAKKLLFDIEQRLTTFRREVDAIDPRATTEASVKIVSNLRMEAANVQAELRQLRSISAGSNARLMQLQHRLDAINEQIAAEQEGMTGRQAALPEVIEEFNLLTLHQELAGENYSSALLSRRNAEADMRRQTLYLVPVVEPSIPVEPRLPRRWRDLALVALAAAAALIVTRLIAKAVGDHR